MDNYKNIAKRFLTKRIYNCKHEFNTTPEPLTRESFCNYCSKLKSSVDFTSEPFLYLNLQTVKEYLFDLQQKSFKRKVSKIERIVKWRHSKIQF
ncbi:hypothetical protein GW932_02670 [archaeon]|nr:hypothetical protein [archaeon]